MNYYKKYLKYKTKYLTLLDKLDKINNNIQEGGESKYICEPNKQKYEEICIKYDNGNYKTKEECEKECDPKFISIQLKKANIHKETLQFYFFIQDMIDKENMSIYIKGGNVIGLAVLKLIYNTYKNNDKKFSYVFKDFLRMELIKDWDFAGHTNNKEIDIQYRTILDLYASKQKLVHRAKTFILYQTKHPILIYDKALFEISILDSESTNFSKMEIPMTTMKIQIDLTNIKYIFMLAKSFYSWNKNHIPIDLNIVKKILSSIEIIVHPHKAGLYDPDKKLDVGELNKNLVKFIQSFTNGDIYWTQFLITQLEDPYRLIYRMCEKNITKTKKITDFIKKNINKKSLPSWLLDVNKTMNVINRFINEFGKKLAQIYKQTNKLNNVLDFLSGTQFGKPQIQMEWEKFNQETKLRLIKIFEPLVNQIGLSEFKNIINSYKSKLSTKSSNLTNNDKIIKLFEFLIEKKVI